MEGIKIKSDPIHAVKITLINSFVRIMCRLSLPHKMTNFWSSKAEFIWFTVPRRDTTWQSLSLRCQKEKDRIGCSDWGWTVCAVLTWCWWHTEARVVRGSSCERCYLTNDCLAHAGDFSSNEQTVSLDKLVYRNFLKQSLMLHLKYHCRAERRYAGNLRVSLPDTRRVWMAPEGSENKPELFRSKESTELWDCLNQKADP